MDNDQFIPTIVEAGRVRPVVEPPKAEASAASQETAREINERVDTYKRGGRA